MPNINDFLLNLPMHYNWWYAIIFIFAIAETLPILGTFVPGHTVIILSGFLAKLGILRLEAVISVVVIGVIAGDLLAYYIGRKFGYDFVIRYGKYFYLNEEKYKATKDLASEHTGKALIIGRFNPFTRALAAFLAGICRIKFLKFLFYSIVGGAGWSVFSVFIGYIAGQGFEGAVRYFGRIVLTAFALIIFIFFVYRALNKRKQIFVKKHRWYLTLNMVSIYVFFKMIRGSVYRFDFWISENTHLMWRGWLNKLMIVITNILSPESLCAIAMIAAVYFFMKKNKCQAALISCSVFGGLILCLIMKTVVGRLRPIGGLVNEIGFSFPSQHATIALIFFVLAIFLFTGKIKNKLLKILFISGNIFLIALVGFSRIYLKAHWFSDVAAGFAFGLFWVTFLILVFAFFAKLLKKQL
ncbi:MAG: bifunctional DedA family/phosphatase PAP2 family protein [bacterium]